jgi:chromosome segregation ATPase
VADELVTLLVALLGGGFLGSLIQGLFYRRKLGADYANVIAESATGLLGPLRERVQELEDEVSTTRSELAKAHTKITALLDRLDGAYETLGEARVALADANSEVRLLRSELWATRHENTQGGDAP